MKRKTKEVKVILTTKIKVFETEIQQFLDAGWDLHGEFVFIKGQYYFQMVKR